MSTNPNFAVLFAFSSFPPFFYAFISSTGLLVHIHPMNIRPHSLSPPTASALYRIPPSHPLSHSMDNDIEHPQNYQSTSCIPSLLPPGMDPASVDFRTFYPYIPNEVKHRKRTSRPQLKVLEDVFRRDTKPNAALRKKLANQLDMTARGVQVRLVLSCVWSKPCFEMDLFLAGLVPKQVRLLLVFPTYTSLSHSAGGLKRRTWPKRSHLQGGRR